MSMMAYCVPNAWNIWIVNKGKAAKPVRTKVSPADQANPSPKGLVTPDSPAAKELRMAELAAIALAATGRNASTRSGRARPSQFRIQHPGMRAKRRPDLHKKTLWKDQSMPMPNGTVAICRSGAAEGKQAVS